MATAYTTADEAGRVDTLRAPREFNVAVREDLALGVAHVLVRVGLPVERRGRARHRLRRAHITVFPHHGDVSPHD